jgi:hypothetical protein
VKGESLLMQDITKMTDNIAAAAQAGKIESVGDDDEEEDTKKGRGI